MKQCSHFGLARHAILGALQDLQHPAGQTTFRIEPFE
jgi:hypothetical protein